MAQEPNALGAPHGTEDIRNEIERTRVEMTETIGQIQDRLRPDHLLQQAKDGVRAAAAGKVRNIMHSAGETAHTVATRARGAGEHLADYAAAHPIRMAVTIGAVTWWMLRGRNRTPDWAGATEGAWEDQAEFTFDDSRSLRDKVGEYASSARDTVSGYASSARQTAGEYASSARETAGAYAQSAREGAGRASERVRTAAGSAGTSVDDWVHENPLAAGVIALAIGAAIGLVAPRTVAEDRAMGETRDQALERASRIAHELKHTVTSKVQSVAETLVNDSIAAANQSEPMGRA